MGTSSRQTSNTLEQQFYESPGDFSFLKGLEILEKNHEGLLPQKKTGPDQKNYFLRSKLSWEVSASEIGSLKKDKNNFCEVTVNFLNIAGHNGPLPTMYSEKIMEQVRDKQNVLKDFLDLFQHRLLSIWRHLAREKDIGLVNFSADKHAMGRTLYDLSGIHRYDFKKSSLKDINFTSIASLIWKRPSTEAGLEQVLNDFFDHETKVTSCQGGWIKAEKAQVSIIGKDGAYNTLGETCILGNKQWSQTLGVRLSVLNLHYNDYMAIYLNNSLLDLVNDITQYYVNGELVVHFFLHINPSQKKQTSVDGKSLLGANTWLGKARSDAQRDNEIKIVLRPQAREIQRT